MPIIQHHVKDKSQPSKVHLCEAISHLCCIPAEGHSTVCMEMHELAHVLSIHSPADTLHWTAVLQYSGQTRHQETIMLDITFRARRTCKRRCCRVGYSYCAARSKGGMRWCRYWQIRKSLRSWRHRHQIRLCCWRTFGCRLYMQAEVLADRIQVLHQGLGQNKTTTMEHISAIPSNPYKCQVCQKIIPHNLCCQLTYL